MTKSIGIGGLERDMTNEEWGAHLRERERRELDAPYHGSEHYIGALERLKEHSVATARREEHERQKDGISGNGGDAFIGKMCNTGPPGDRFSAYFIQVHKDRPVKAVPSTSPHDRPCEDKPHMKKHPVDTYNPITQEYSDMNEAISPEEMKRREMRLRPWSLFYPQQPLGTPKDLPATRDNVRELLFIDPSNPPSEPVKNNRLGKSNTSRLVGDLLDHTIEREPVKLTPRQSFNTIFQQYYNEEDQRKVDEAADLALKKSREDAKLKALRFETNYDPITLQHKITGIIPPVEVVVKPYRNGSDIFFTNEKTKTMDMRVVKTKPRGRNPVMESTLDAIPPKIIRSRGRNTIIDGDGEDSARLNMTAPPPRPAAPWDDMDSLRRERPTEPSYTLRSPITTPRDERSPRSVRIAQRVIDVRSSATESAKPVTYFHPPQDPTPPLHSSPRRASQQGVDLIRPAVPITYHDMTPTSSGRYR